MQKTSFSGRFNILLKMLAQFSTFSTVKVRIIALVFMQLEFQITNLFDTPLLG